MNKQSSNQMHQRFVSTSQGQIAILDSRPGREENAPTVIFLHGHCTHKGFFSRQLESVLLRDYRLIALDLPGYGESDPPKDPEKVYSFSGFAAVVAEVINLMKLKNIVVVGWSLGGHVALELTSSLKQLKGLLITGTPPIEISAKGLGLGFRVSNPEVLECFGKGNLSYEEAELLATVAGYDYSEEKKFIVDAILQTDEGAKTIYPQSILKGIGQNELRIVSEWPHPIAVIAGEDDTGINNDYIMNEVKFRNLWCNKVHLISGAGHAVFMERPDAFNAILQGFLQDIFQNYLTTTEKTQINFKPVDAAHRSLVHSWLVQPHVAEWFYGQGLANTFEHLDQFLHGSSQSQYWLAYDKDHPFAFLITSSVCKPDDKLTHWCVEEGEAITLDMLIGDTMYLGKGLSHLLIQEFLLTQFPEVTEVLIDPEATNLRAVHVYQKVGFSILDKFIPSHSPHPHYMMRLNMNELIKKR